MALYQAGGWSIIFVIIQVRKCTKFLVLKNKPLFVTKKTLEVETTKLPSPVMRVVGG